MVTRDIASITSEVFALLEPRSPEERQRVVKAVFALLGDELSPAVITTRARDVGAGSGMGDVRGAGAVAGAGPRAASWARHHGLTQEDLDRAFYFHDGKVDIHVNEVPGASKREQTTNCYLLVGLRSFLATDSPTFTDPDAMALCRHTQAYDKNNHPRFRGSLGNLVNGSKDGGFELAGPGLKAAGELILAMRQSGAA